MARETITRVVSDLSKKTIPEGEAATIRISFDDKRRGTYQVDATIEEAMEIASKGKKVARRGRKPKES